METSSRPVSQGRTGFASRTEAGSPSPERSDSPLRSDGRRAAAAKPRRKSTRREAIRLTHAPVKFTNSQFDLFAASTGNDIRTGDPYARFLIGPRKVRVDVPTLQELEEEVRRNAAAAARSGGKFFTPGRPKVAASNASIVTVGKPTKGFSKKSFKLPPSKKKYRIMKKEQFKTDVFQKWDRLEDLRIQIISRMHSLKHCHAELQSLKLENQKLKEEHAKLSKSMNSRVTEILSLNASRNDTIRTVYQDRKRQRRELQQSLVAVDKAGRVKLGSLEAVLNARRAKFAELEHELELLNTFQEISITSPSTLATQHSNAIALQKTLQTRHVQTLEKIRAQDESDRRDMEGVFASRILGIVAVTKRGIPKSDQAVLQHSMQTSARLQKEIDMHLCVQEEITQDIERVKRDRVEAKRLKVALRDPRRKVLTCPPDMTVLSDEL